MSLDNEEREIVEAYRSGALKPKKLSKGETTRFRDAANATLSKDKRVNIRISSSDLQELQLQALEEGLPYQTFMASILHKFLRGKLVEQADNKRGERMLGRKTPSHRSR